MTPEERARKAFPGYPSLWEDVEVVIHEAEAPLREENEQLSSLLKWALEDWVDIECSATRHGHEAVVIRLEPGQGDQRIFRAPTILGALQLAHDAPKFTGGEAVVDWKRQEREEIQRLVEEDTRKSEENQRLRAALEMVNNWRVQTRDGCERCVFCQNGHCAFDPCCAPAKALAGSSSALTERDTRMKLEGAREALEPLAKWMRSTQGADWETRLPLWRDHLSKVEALILDVLLHDRVEKLEKPLEIAGQS